MRRLMLLILMMCPAIASASLFEVRIRIWPQFSPGLDPAPLHQRWLYAPMVGRTRANTTSSTDTTIFRNRAGQVWHRPARIAPPEPIGMTQYDDQLTEQGLSTEHTFQSGTPNYRVLRTVEVVATAYNSRRDQTDGTPWRVATGRLVRDGDIACNFLPLGTLVRITNGPDIVRGKIYRVEDRLASPPPLGWNQIDVWMLHVSDAVAFGKKSLTLQVLGDPRGEAPH